MALNLSNPSADLEKALKKLAPRDVIKIRKVIRRQGSAAAETALRATNPELFVPKTPTEGRRIAASSAVEPPSEGVASHS